MKDELQGKDKYGDARRTEIIPDEHEFNAEDFYPNDPVVITGEPSGIYQAYTAEWVPANNPVVE